MASGISEKRRLGRELVDGRESPFKPLAWPFSRGAIIATAPGGRDKERR
jgi:hypothetical protein